MLQTNASATGLGAALTQIVKSAKEHPIRYAKRVLQQQDHKRVRSYCSKASISIWYLEC